MTSAAASPLQQERWTDHDGWPYPPLVVEVGGPMACFTRPELKGERVSYPLMTPSAAKGLLESIFWKPQFRYVITRIEVLAEVRWLNLRRNEVASPTSQKAAALRKDPRAHYDAAEDRDQRNLTGLRDVAYRVHAQVQVHKDAGAPAAKYRDQLRRRVERGACFAQPSLGMREFIADFGPPTDRQPVAWSEELGVMLHSIIYPPKDKPREPERYGWFRATVDNGVMHVPYRPLPSSATAMPDSAWRTDAEGK